MSFRVCDVTLSGAIGDLWLSDYRVLWLRVDRSVSLPYASISSLHSDKTMLTLTIETRDIRRGTSNV